jgi:hypothetical protein
MSPEMEQSDQESDDGTDDDAELDEDDEACDDDCDVVASGREGLKESDDRRTPELVHDLPEERTKNSSQTIRRQTSIRNRVSTGNAFTVPDMKSVSRDSTGVPTTATTTTTTTEGGRTSVNNVEGHGGTSSASGEGARRERSSADGLSYEDYYTRDALYVLPPLFLAAATGNAAIARELIRHGANVNAIDLLGCTPLHLLLCQQRLNRSLLKLLLANGARLSTRNHCGVAPIDLLPGKSLQLLQLQRKMVIAAFAGLLTGADGVSGGQGGPGEEQGMSYKESERRESTVDHEFPVPVSCKHQSNSTETAPLEENALSNDLLRESTALDRSEEADSGKVIPGNLLPIGRNRSLEPDRSDLFGNEAAVERVEGDTATGFVGAANAFGASTSSLSSKVTGSDKKSKTVSFLRKLKASAMSRAGRAKVTGNTLTVTAKTNSSQGNSSDNFLCLEEISSDGPSYGSSR